VLNSTSVLFIRQKLFAFVFIIKFTKRFTALAQFRSELNFRSIQARTIAKPRTVGGKLEKT
jgi:anthranilate phosphoribosyltransferase